MPIKNYRWGILGAGRIAEKFCTALCFVEGSEVYAVASRDINKAKAYAAKFNASKFYDNYEELVNDDQVDIIYIATPHIFHYEQTMLCLQHKKPVLCEKPMSVSNKLSAEMISVAEQNKVFLMEGLWTASMPFIEKIKAIIADGMIGELKYVAADFGFAAPKDLDGRLYNKALAGGSLLDVGVYPVSFATMLLGEPLVIKTISKLAETGIDEYANLIMQYADGITAHALCSITFNTNVEAQIIGTKGRIQVKNPWFKATDFSVYLNDGNTHDFSFPHECNGFEHEIREVMHCLGNGMLQSDKVPHQLTLSVSKIMDEALTQAGVVYD